MRHSEGQGWILLLAVSILLVISIGWINGDPLPRKVHARLPSPDAVPRDRHRLLSGPSMAELARQGPSYSDVWRRFYHPPSEKPRPPWDAYLWQSNAWQKVSVINSDGMNFLVRHQEAQPARPDEWISDGNIVFGDEPPEPIETPVQAQLSGPVETVPLPLMAGTFHTANTNTTLTDVMRQSNPLLENGGWAFLSPGPGAPGTPPPIIHGSPRRGDLLVHRDGAWWPAQIIQTQGNRLLVRYASHGSESDEWVTGERVSVYAGDAAEP